MSKQPKLVNFAEVFQSLDNEVSVILQKCNNCSSIELLSSDELNKLINFIFDLINQNNLEEVSEENIKKLRISLELLLFIITSDATAEIKLKFIDIVKYTNNELLTDELGIINLVSKINEFWMLKMQTAEQIQGMEYLTLKNLLTLCTSEKPLVLDIKRLSGIRKAITADPFDKTVPSLRPLLVKLVQNLQVLSSDHGQRFIAQALVLSHKLMMEIHKTIMLDLGSCNGKKATKYGKVYVMAWQVASEDMKKVLVKSCFQHLMESILKEQRTSLELNRNSQNILAVLEVWHLERKKKNPDFITMITDAYQPILWKYLQSGFNVHRCNATDVFFKAFPLQRMGDKPSDAEALFKEQYDAMLASLKDDCHIIRIIGIREVCNILSIYWNSFNPLQIQSLMSVITKQNAHDASCADVRRMVYLGFQNLVKSPLSREYVKEILPNLADNIHDVNQKVRIAFFQLLICIRELKDPNFKYHDCVSMFNIQYRLAEDGIAVGQWIVKLLIRNYYHSNMSPTEWMKRFIYLIKTYRNSYRNFFFYSGKSLTFTDACTIIYEILTQVGTFVAAKYVTDEESIENPGKSRKRTKDGKRVPLSEQNRSYDSSGTEGESKKCIFEDADVVTGLFDIVTILWIIHDVRITKPENEETRLKLYHTYIKYAQPLINYYKDCNLFLGIIALSGNIPASFLRNYSITLPGYCVKMLKSIKVDRSDEENEKLVSMLTALIKWGRGFEILEQITLWLDAAFETKDMNETILPRRRVKINENIQPNSIVAINILDILLKRDYMRLSILEKNYQELFALWKFMSRIQKLIETRIDQGEPFEEELVCDEFLNRCFQRFVKMIPLLKEDEKADGEEKENQSQNPNDAAETFVKRQKEMETVVEWGESFLFPLLQDENLQEADAKLIITALEDILYVADNMIIVHVVNNMFQFKIAHFVLKLLGTRYGVRFVKAASRITAALNFSAKLLFKVKDDLHIFSTVIPSLLSHTLDVMASRHQRNEAEKLEEDLPIVKTCFGKILAAYQDNLSSMSSLKVNVRQLKLVVSLFTDCIVHLISQEIPREDSTIPVYSTPSQLPTVACCLLSLFHNKKTWTPLFLHVVSSKLSGKDVTAKDTVSCILLLKLFAVSDKKLNQADLKKALESASSNLTKLKEGTEADANGDVNDIITDTETETTDKQTWPSNAATKGYSSTWTKEGAPKERRSEEPEEEGKTEAVQSFLCEGNNLEMDLINCGFELIKSIASENQAMEVEVS